MEEINKIEVGGTANFLESNFGEGIERMKAINKENADKIKAAADKLGIQIAANNYVKETKSVNLKNGKRFVKYEIKTTAHFFDKDNGMKKDLNNELDDSSLTEKVKGYIRSQVTKELKYKKPESIGVPGSMGVRG